MDFEEIEKTQNIYVILEKINGKWYIKNFYVSYKKAIDWVFQAREWETRWKEQGFAFAPTPAIYKIVRYKATETFTIEQ